MIGSNSLKSPRAWPEDSSFPLVARIATAMVNMMILSGVTYTQQLPRGTGGPGIDKEAKWENSSGSDANSEISLQQEVGVGYKCYSSLVR